MSLLCSTQTLASAEGGDTEVIDDFNQVEIVVPVQEERHNYCGVPGRNPVAKVFEPGKIPGRNGKPFDDRPREDNCDDNLRATMRDKGGKIPPNREQGSIAT